MQSSSNLQLFAMIDNILANFVRKSYTTREMREEKCYPQNFIVKIFSQFLQFFLDLKSRASVTVFYDKFSKKSRNVHSVYEIQMKSEKSKKCLEM